MTDFFKTTFGILTLISTFVLILNGVDYVITGDAFLGFGRTAVLFLLNLVFAGIAQSL